MRLRRDLSGDQLASALKALGYEVTRQTGSHSRLTTHRHGEHHVTIPRHGPLRVGTLAAIIRDIAVHFQVSRDELLSSLDL